MTSDHTADTAGSPDVSNRTVAGPHGDIPVRVYLPRASRREPLGLVWCHGGAFAFGDLDMPESDWVASTLAGFGITVVAVDYRLAAVPEWAVAAGAPAGRGSSPYPVAREEAAAVLAWAESELASASPTGWALGGASAGGAIVAAATMHLRDVGARLPRRLLLAYPLLHATLPPYSAELQAKLDSGLQPTDIPLTRENIEAICLSYAGGDRGVLGSAHAFPGGHDATGFPPTMVVHSDADTVRSSSATFAGELASVGVAVTSIVEPGTQHGHLNDPDSPGGLRSLRRIAQWLIADWVASESDPGAAAAS